MADSLSTFEKVYFVASVNGYSLVDYALTGSSGKRKRAWISSTKIGAMPTPAGSLYANVDYNGYIGDSRVDTNALYMYNCFIALGFSPQAACGLLGNIMQECSMNPAKWVINSITNADVYGIFQWDAASKYLNRAVQQGLITTADITSIQAYVRGESTETLINNPEKIAILIMSQIECMIWESLENYAWGDPEVYNYIHHREDEKVMAFREFAVSTDNAGLLALTFLDHFERAGNPFENLRVQYANDYYNAFA